MPSIINSDDGVVSGTSGLKTTGGNDGLLNIQTNGSNAISISSGQRSTFPTTIGVGGATPSTSGSGITFPGTQSASSNANTLDDYEEGNFTPTLTAASGSNGGGTFSGSYIKIGRYVYVSLKCESVAKGTLSGQITVGGLPFSVNVVNSTATCRWELSGTPAAGTTVICPQSGGGTGMELQQFGGGGYLGNLAASNLGSTFSIYNITYSYVTDN